MDVIMTSAHGIKADISDYADDLLHMGEYADFAGELSTRRIAAIGHKLVAAGGRLATAGILVALEPYMTRRYANHIANVWGLNGIDDAEIDEDDVPRITVTGVPTGRRRAAG